jgi:rod shape-determining protein MreC
MIPEHRIRDLYSRSKTFVLIYNSVYSIFSRFFFWILIMISIIIMLFYNKSLRFQESTIELFSLGITPVEKLLSKIGKNTNDLYNLFDAYEQNKTLKNEIEKLITLTQELELIKFENRELRELLNFIPENGFRYKTARLISVASGPYVNSGIVLAGSLNNIEKNQILVGTRGVVGRIINVSQHSSKILFITDINSRIPVTTSISRERAIATGNNSKLLDLIYVNEKNNIKPGELVVTSGDGQFYPPDLIIGRVKFIKNGKISVEPFLQLHKLEYVSILTNKK